MIVTPRILSDSMNYTTGFSNVDGSERADELVDYLALRADRLADVRREGYAMLRIAPGSTVLDVGCGAGDVCVELAGIVGDEGTIPGIDPSEAMIAAARRAANYAASLRALLAMIVNPHSGTRLRAMFARAGLAGIEQRGVSIPIPFADYVRALFLHERLAAAVQAGDVTRKEADDFVAVLAARDRDGAFDANAIAYFVAAT